LHVFDERGAVPLAEHRVTEPGLSVLDAAADRRLTVGLEELVARGEQPLLGGGRLLSRAWELCRSFDAGRGDGGCKCS